MLIVFEKSLYARRKIVVQDKKSSRKACRERIVIEKQSEMMNVKRMCQPHCRGSIENVCERKKTSLAFKTSQ
jgi:hypothetical protein